MNGGERRLITPMRLVLVIGGAFVMAAGFQLYVLAEATDRFFAWTIEPPVTAAFLGACYWAAGVLAFLSAREPTWARARLGVPGVLAFIWLTLGLTLLHLDRFHLDDGGVLAIAAAWAWLAIYVIEPPVLLWAFVVQLRAAGGDPPRDDRLPAGFRIVAVAQAAVLTGLGAALVVAPEAVGGAWPWPLSALTGRAVGAWLVAVGLLQAAVAWEDDRRRVRWAMALLITLCALQLLALVRFGGDLDFGEPAMVVYLLFLAGLGAVGAAGWRLGSAGRADSGAASDDPGREDPGHPG